MCESYVFSDCTLQLRSEQARLLALREDNKGVEAALRKAKKRAQQDVEAVIGEYDQDLGSKEEEYQEVRGAGFCVPGVGLGFKYPEVRGWRAGIQVPGDVGFRVYSLVELPEVPCTESPGPAALPVRTLWPEPCVSIHRPTRSTRRSSRGSRCSRPGTMTCTASGRSTRRRRGSSRMRGCRRG